MITWDRGLILAAKFVTSTFFKIYLQHGMWLNREVPGARTHMRTYVRTHERIVRTHVRMYVRTHVRIVRTYVRTHA